MTQTLSRQININFFEQSNRAHLGDKKHLPFMFQIYDQLKTEGSNKRCMTKIFHTTKSKYHTINALIIYLS